MALPARVVMYFMFFATSTLHFLTREMAPMLIPMICDSYGYTMAQRGCERSSLPPPLLPPSFSLLTLARLAVPAVLLGSYFPGYIIGQIPSAMLANKIGCTATLTLANLGTIAAMLATPLAAGSVNALAMVTTLLGLVGGSMFPVSGMLKRLWIPPSLPDGERAFALRVTTWGVNIGRFLTAILTSTLSQKYGWRKVPVIYAAIVAVFAVPFQLLASDSPAAWAKRARPAMSPQELEMLTAGDAAPPAKDVAPPRRTLADYKFLVSVASLCPIILHTADNMTSYCLAYWAPTYFMVRLTSTFSLATHSLIQL
eukprot:COSAG03_NODE_1637_length_3734_cov_504.619807_2_plen_312_part_00